MMPAAQGCIVVVVAVVLTTQRVRHFTQCFPAMRQRDVPGGKKPAKESQQRKDSKRKTHCAGYRLDDGLLSNPVSCSRLTNRSRNAFAMTETELRLMAAPAMMGLRSRPKKG